MRIGSLLAFTLAAPLLVAATQPLRLEPSSPWVVDYAPESCRLIRTFGEGKTLTKLAFDSSAPGNMDMLVIGNPLSTWDEQVQGRFLPASNRTIVGRSVLTVPDHKPALLWGDVQMMPDNQVEEWHKFWDGRKNRPGIRPAPIDLAARDVRRKEAETFAQATSALEIETGRRKVILETGSLGPAIAKFNECSRNSLRDWGVDPDVEDKIVRPVWALNTDAWISGNDYPRDMLMRGKQSAVDVRLLIDAAGRVTKCTSLSHFTEEEFNRITCDLITKRAKFDPAELADGTKVPSYYTRRVEFRLTP